MLDNNSVFNNFLLDSLKLNVIQNLANDTATNTNEPQNGLKTKTESQELFARGAGSHTNGLKHAQTSGGHVNGNTHNNNGVAGGRHWNVNNPPFSQANAHYDRYTQTTHSQAPHSQSGHSQSRHSQSPHSQSHGNHSNHSQNARPTVTISNDSNLINFTFTKQGRMSPLTQYGPGLYNNSYATAQNKYNGVFVVVRMRDTDSTNYQDGTVYLRSGSSTGTTLAKCDILWSSSSSVPGTDRVRSGGSYKNGYAYFSKDVIASASRAGIGDLQRNNIYIVAEVKDYRSSTSSTTLSTTRESIRYINIDTLAPTGSIRINNGAATTTTTATTLNISASGATQMMISNDSSFTGSNWETYATTKAWTIAAPYNVYIKFKDTYGNESTVYSDSITYTTKVDAAKLYEVYSPSYYSNTVSASYKYIEGDWLKFKYVFHVNQPINERDLAVRFNFNDLAPINGVTLYDNSVNVKLQSVAAISKNINGSFMDAVNGSPTFTDINSFTLNKQSTNVYENTNVGINRTLAPGDYALDFKVKIKIDPSVYNKTTTTANSSIVVQLLGTTIPPADAIPSSNRASAYIYLDNVIYN